MSDFGSIHMKELPVSPGCHAILHCWQVSRSMDVSPLVTPLVDWDTPGPLAGVAKSD